MALTFDNKTFAALPGGIAIDKSKFLNFFKIKGFWKFYYSIILNSKLEKLYSKYPKDNVVQQWISLSEHFQYGCANPSIVISKENGVYATYTDLTNDGGASTPVIKIVQLKHAALKNIELNDNDRTVTVATYFGKGSDINARAWIDFDPLLPELFSTNKRSRQILQEKIKESAWKCLSAGLSQIKNIDQPGLYYLELSDEDTKDAY